MKSKQKVSSQDFHPESIKYYLFFIFFFKSVLFPNFLCSPFCSYHLLDIPYSLIQQKQYEYINILN